jgi:hypothetical protein
MKYVNRPTHPYDPAWLAYWDSNPTFMRGVGADAAADADGDADGDAEAGDGDAVADADAAAAAAADKDKDGAGDGDADDNKVLLSDDGDGEGGGGAPESYDYEPPQDVEIDEAAQGMLDEFSGVAKELELSQVQYQALVDYEVKRANGAMDDGAAQFANRVTDWGAATKKDAEIGGEDLSANLGVAKVAMDQFASDGFKALLAAPSVNNPEGLGLGNHPEVVRHFYRIGKALADDDLIIGTAGRADGEDSLKRMYPSMFQKT